jgi:hypothetical protein
MAKLVRWMAEISGKVNRRGATVVLCEAFFTAAL